MKNSIKIISFFVFFSTINVFSQYGQDGVIVTGAILVKHNAERKKYKEINKWQKTIKKANAAIAAETALIANLEKKIYKSYSTVNQSIKEAGMLLDIIKTSDKIYEKTDKILELGTKNIKLGAVASKEVTALLLDVGFIMADYLIAMEEGKTNLLNSAERYFVLDFFQKRLKKIYRKTTGIYYNLKTIDKLTKYHDLDKKIDPSILKIDFSNIHKNIAKMYKEALPNLKTK